MKLFYPLGFLALGSIAAAEANLQERSDVKGLKSCHIPELKKGHLLRASCFPGGSKEQIIHSELDLNHCFGASLLKGDLTVEADGHFSRKCVRCQLGGGTRGTGTHEGPWSLYCHCLAPKAEIQLEPTVWMNNQGILECHGHVGKVLKM
ncbi:hypothetical protein BDV26DRAFT_287902 [Aspergillus bertholletiae]|uniref:Cyanovirin-N domain-containing protein n=1 Tax=Aspergillus bertholletiae TaxID=1226010 RepID=A0A5N7BNN3_9EURO|nr:hypothetical protein BDV26DRAFT_287902 [Aspergillus bertholletiae]